MTHPFIPSLYLRQSSTANIDIHIYNLTPRNTRLPGGKYPAQRSYSVVMVRDDTVEYCEKSVLESDKANKIMSVASASLSRHVPQN